MGTVQHQPIVIITGATGGIGYHLCLGFLEAGFKIVALDKEMLQELPKEIDFIKVDLLNEEEIRGAFRYIKASFGYANILINNGAIANFCRPIHELTTKEFDKVIQVNLRAAFICSQAFIDLNEGQSYGRIINIASTRWLQNEVGWDAYGASKGGLVSLTCSMSVSLSSKPITVNAISPGWIQTENYDSLTVQDHQQHPSGRVGIPRDVVNAALFLAHKENDFINGINLIVDGGMTKKMIYE